MHIWIANPKKKEPIGHARSGCQSKKLSREVVYNTPIANLKLLKEEIIGFAPRKPSEEIIGHAHSETIGYINSDCL